MARWFQQIDWVQLQADLRAIQNEGDMYRAAPPTFMPFLSMAADMQRAREGSVSKEVLINSVNDTPKAVKNESVANDQPEREYDHFDDATER